MKYQKKPTPKQIETLLSALRYALESGNEFMVIAELGESGLSAGSGRMSLVEYVVKAMFADNETGNLILNIAMNFLSNQILNDVCGNCDKAEQCDKKESACDPENLFDDIKHQIEEGLKLTKIGKN